jgi:hypothetical protein
MELEELGPADAAPEHGGLGDVGQEASFEHPAPMLDIPDLGTAPSPSAGLDLPSLDLPRPSAKPKAPASAPSQPMGRSFDDGIDGMESDDAAPEWARPAAKSVAPAALPYVKPVSGVLLSEDGGKEEAARLAAYGPVPPELWKAPLYAYRVKMRQLELKRELVARRADLAKAQAAVDDALVVLAERGRKAVEGNDAYGKLTSAVILAESTLKDRDSALAAETEAHQKQTSALDAQLGKHEAEMAGARAEEKACQAAFDRVDDVRRRIDAKVKRVEIDLRSAVARASSGPAGAAGAAADPEVISRTAEREARLAELAQSMPAVTEATQKLNVVKRKVADIQQKILGVKNERAALEDKFQKRGAAHGAEVQKAQLEVRTARAALGRVMAEDHATFGGEWAEARKELAELDLVQTGRDDAVILHVMALDAHDGDAMKKGVGILAGVALFLCLLMTVPVIVSLGGKPPPPPPAAPAAVNPDE